MKAQCHLPTGELQLLPVPEGRWETISIDFIIELLESGGYDTIMVVVDSVGKRSHFVETVMTITATRAASPLGKCIGFAHRLARSLMEEEIKAGKIE
jgi:hypothetical protein